MEQLELAVPIPYDAKDVTKEWLVLAFEKSNEKFRDAKVVDFRQEKMQENGLLSSIFHAAIEYSQNGKLELSFNTMLFPLCSFRRKESEKSI